MLRDRAARGWPLRRFGFRSRSTQHRVALTVATAVAVAVAIAPAPAGGDDASRLVFPEWQLAVRAPRGWRLTHQSSYPNILVALVRSRPCA